MTFVNILMFDSVSVAYRAKSLCSSQLMPRLRQVLDREGVVHERAGMETGQSGQPSVRPPSRLDHNVTHQSNRAR